MESYSYFLAHQVSTDTASAKRNAMRHGMETFLRVCHIEPIKDLINISPLTKPHHPSWPISIDSDAQNVLSLSKVFYKETSTYPSLYRLKHRYIVPYNQYVIHKQNYENNKTCTDFFVYTRLFWISMETKLFNFLSK